MPRIGRSNTMARRYKGRPDTFRTDLVCNSCDFHIRSSVAQVTHFLALREMCTEIPSLSNAVFKIKQKKFFFLSFDQLFGRFRQLCTGALSWELRIKSSVYWWNDKLFGLSNEGLVARENTPVQRVIPCRTTHERTPIHWEKYILIFPVFYRNSTSGGKKYLLSFIGKLLFKFWRK